MNKIERALMEISRVSLWFSGLGLVAMTAIIGAQVFARFVAGNSLDWSEQAALLLMIWFILPAAAVGVREGFHVEVSALTEAVSPARARVLALVSHGLVCSFGAAMLIWGTELVLRTWSHSIPALSLPRGFGYIPIPLSGLLVLIFASEQLVATWRRRPVAKLWN